MIPLKIYQTGKDYNLSLDTKKLISGMVSTNPAFEYSFMDNEECHSFIKENFEYSFVSMYEGLPLDIMRADVWRLAVIYINGGVYSDCDVICHKDFSSLIYEQSLVVFAEKNGGVSNFFFAAIKKHPVIKRTLDRMAEMYRIAFNSNSDFLVQNFGMNIFHEEVLKEESKKMLTYQESLEWVSHLCYGSWRESEHKFRSLSNNTKNVTFFTTFNENGYNLYGKSWIDSIKKNVLSKRSNIRAIIYAHGFKLPKDIHPNIIQLDFDSVIPEHSLWKREFDSRSRFSQHVNDFTIRFSHKGFVIQHALSNINGGYAVWADGDVLFTGGSYDGFPDNLFSSGEVLACQVEDGNHVESGILFFDTDHPDLIKFINAYKKNYSIDDILNKYAEPYDGHVTRRSLDHSQVKYNDLNMHFGKSGIQSDPNETFLHPEIRSRFTHNIGVTGKTRYDAWDKIKSKDKIFRILDGIISVTSNPEVKKILGLRHKRLKSNA